MNFLHEYFNILNLIITVVPFMLVLYDYGGCIDHSVILKLTNRLAISLDKEVAVILII